MSSAIKNDFPKDELRDKYVYNPDKRYYFLSVLYCGNAPAWIRRPFQTEDEIREFLEIYYESKKGIYKSLEIFGEDLLREKIRVLNKEGGYVDTNMRHWVFDDRYTSDADYYSEILSGTRHLSWKEGYRDWLNATNEIE